MDANTLAMLSLLVAVATIVVTIVVYRLQRKRKSLHSSLISGTNLLQHRAARIQDLELRYRETAVEDPYLIILKFENDGNEPITPEDYERPVRISFPSDCRPLSAEVVDTSHDDMAASMNIDGHEAVLAPVLLNAGDYITCQVLLDRPPDSWEVKGRITGVQEIGSHEQRRKSFSPIAKTILTLLVVGAFFWLIAFSFSPTADKHIPWLKDVLPLVLGAAMILFLALWLYMLYSSSD